MEHSARLQFCKVCKQKKFDLNRGIICSLTDNPPTFENTCPDFTPDEKLIEKAKIEYDRKANDKRIGGIFDKENTYMKHVRPTLAIIAILALGIIMILHPDAIENAADSGRKPLTRAILKYIWGIPAGIVLTGLGGFLFYKKFLRKKST